MKIKAIALIFLIATLFLSACGAAAPRSATVDEAGSLDIQSAPAAAEKSASQMGAAEVEAPAAAEAPNVQTGQGEAQALMAMATPVLSSGGLTDTVAQGTGRMVLKDAVMDLLVQNTDRAVNDVTDLAATQGGYIVSARSWYTDDQKFANIRMAVPSANFERTLTFLRALGIQVLNETASGQDVSAEYNDLQARLTNLEATAARVRTFLDQATTVEDSLRINQTLSDLEGQIEQVKGQMKFYEGRAAFSTIEVNLSPEQPTPTITPTPSPTPTPTPWNPGATIQQASRRGIGLWQDIFDGLIWLCFLAWPLLLVGLLVWLVVWLVRRSRKPKPQTASETPPAPSQETPANK